MEKWPTVRKSWRNGCGIKDWFKTKMSDFIRDLERGQGEGVAFAVPSPGGEEADV